MSGVVKYEGVIRERRKGGGGGLGFDRTPARARAHRGFVACPKAYRGTLVRWVGRSTVEKEEEDEDVVRKNGVWWCKGNGWSRMSFPFSRTLTMTCTSTGKRPGGGTAKVSTLACMYCR